MTYSEIRRSLEVWPGNAQPEYLQQIDTIIRQAEARIGMLVEIPAYQKTINVGITTSTLALPADFVSLDFIYLPNYGNLEMKSQSFILEAFPDPTSTGQPRFVGLKDSLTLVFGPTPDATYVSTLQYSSIWPSIIDVTAGTETYISSRFPNALLHGSLYYAALFSQDFETAQAEKQEMMDGLGLVTDYAKNKATKQESEKKTNAAIED